MFGVKKILEIHQFKEYGFEVRKVLVNGNTWNCPDFVSESAYTLDGKYIGDLKTARHLCIERGIKPELKDPDSKTCSIGFCEKEQKWYGWSHRAIYGYGIGDIVKEGTIPTQSGYVDGYLEEHPEKDRRVPGGFVVKTLEDAKRVAIAFADSVS